MVNTASIQTISDHNGKPMSVLVPIALWHKIEATQTWLAANQGNAWNVQEKWLETVEAPNDLSIKRDSLWDIVGMAEGEEMDVARQHDKYLYGC